MAKLIRCSGGHVFDSDAHETCPECERLGIRHRPASASASQAGGGDADKLRPKPSLPVKAAALAAGGAALLALAGYFMFAEPRVISDTAIAETDADFAACDKSNRPVEACDKAIQSKKFAGAALNALYRLRGDAYFSAGKYDMASKDYDTLLAQLSDKELGIAIAEFDQAIMRDAKDYFPFFIRGVAWKRKNETTKAVADFRKAMALNPPEDMRKTLLAELKALGSDDANPTPEAPANNDVPQKPAPATPPQEQQTVVKPKVLTDADEIRADPDFKACTSGPSRIDGCKRAIASGKFNGAALGIFYSNLGHAHTQTRDWSAALEYFEAAVRFDPDNMNALVNRGAMLYYKGEYDRALSDFEQAIARNPKDPFFYWRRGLVRWAKAEPDAASADFRKTLELAPPDNIRQHCETSLKEIGQGKTRFEPADWKASAR
ncbi:tetratricopeptide repeat protein [Chelatococcus asaccharovorans]|uniref:Tetratricopeptide repeat protein n=1 Tax=Chelatococcus asaccharovorans TaxID=28210 RepID=A0A2V3TRD6_9HYPH|nr:tetratricopeptide repeat protein [Chelatococcus asaccharovorans]MBS7707910.1 tetratricopeptide repeat protein [Chelatococcus asaccharovorans]PXW51160.1 tetratricopeptide repeat protein [Chelatococcus asaccharovorans]